MKRILLVSIVMIFVSCKGENPFVSEEFIKEYEEAFGLMPVENVVFIFENEIYRLDNFKDSPKKITSSPNESKSHVKYTNDYLKIAYLNENGTPVIIDSVGNEEEILTQFSGIKQMDWLNNNSLYMLIENNIEFYGQPVTIPQIVKEPEEEIISLAITNNRDLLYIVQRRTFYGLSQRLIKLSQGGEEVILEKEGAYYMKSINLSKDGNYFTVSCSELPDDHYYDLIKIYSLEDMELEEDIESMGFLSPIYDFESKYLVWAEQFDSWSGTFKLSAIYIEEYDDESNIIKDDYSSTLNDIYIDWK
ncbi:hypothetical protein GCM10011506_33160 [Marivirga lumbricoides]|uniref:DUF4221 domain-containing protein n=1 Tax=Marivirga lumbricoides TaxID=1046115 RepID=A0ABQ1MR63_9BACT|nr:hypothetical protein GCM10011506_33160 [Marivirga lumbricoides]